MAKIDDVRDYWNERPCNVRHSKADIEQEPLAYSRQVTARKYFVEPHILGFAEFYEWTGCRVLELGCGIGTDTISFARYGAADITALDLSEESVKIAAWRVIAEDFDDGRIMFGFANIENYRDNTLYDLVYSFGVIHHTPNPGSALGTAYVHLREGGTFKLMLYHRKSWKVLKILLRNFGKLLWWRDIDRVVALESEAQTGCPVTYTYTKKSAREMLESVGFVIEEVKVHHIFPYKVSEYIKGKYVMAFPWSIMPRWFFKWLQGKIGWHLCITATRPVSALRVLAKDANSGAIKGVEKDIRDNMLGAEGEKVHRYTKEEIMEMIEVSPTVCGGRIVSFKQKGEKDD